MSTSPVRAQTPNRRAMRRSLANRLVLTKKQPSQVRIRPRFPVCHGVAMFKTDCIRKILSFHSGIITKSFTCNGCNLVIHSPLVTTRLKELGLTVGSPRNCDHLPPCHCRMLTGFSNWMIRFNTSTSNQCRWISPRLSRLLPKVTSASSMFTAVAIRHWKKRCHGRHQSQSRRSNAGVARRRQGHVDQGSREPAAGANGSTLRARRHQALPALRWRQSRRLPVCRGWSYR